MLLETFPPRAAPGKVLYADVPRHGPQTASFLYRFQPKRYPFYVPRIATTAPPVYPERCCNEKLKPERRKKHFS